MEEEGFAQEIEEIHKAEELKEKLLLNARKEAEKIAAQAALKAREIAAKANEDAKAAETEVLEKARQDIEEAERIAAISIPPALVKNAMEKLTG